MEVKKRFGKAVKEKRNAIGISQEELAMRIGADQAYISRIEAGQINVTIETAEQIANVMQVDVGDLFIAQ